MPYLPTVNRRRVKIMKKILKYSLFGLALAVGASTAAHADPWRHHDPPRPEPWHQHDPARPELRAAPEVDSSLAVSGLSLLGGTLAVLRARRRK
jgi:hypothetical protein